MTKVERAARRAACTERHSMVRLPCRMGSGEWREFPFTSGTASPPRWAARMAARLAASTQQPPRQALAEFEAAARASIQGMGRLVRTGAQPTDYAGGAREAPWRHTTATPSPAARPVATPVTSARVLETPVRAPATRTVTIRTPPPHEATERTPWPGMAGRPAPGEPGWPGPPPNYVPQLMSEQELARERLAVLTETTRATAATPRDQQGTPRTTGLSQATAREIPRTPLTPCRSPVFANTGAGYLLPLAEPLHSSQRGEMQALLELMAQRHVNLRHTGGPWPPAEVVQRELQIRVQAMTALQRSSLAHARMGRGYCTCAEPQRNG